jgi:exonuclease SbcC
VIPQRVRLEGFLCYRDPQEIEFSSSSSLWMLSGVNGSGKSSIFDAVTYALFGHHRGGGQQHVELINKDSDRLLVEFDFLLDGQLYRAKRTLRRNTRGGATGTQQLFHCKPGPGGNSWVALEDTGQKREFDAWVAEHIGLDYDTFTSSVLLLQGKAEKLLDSKPEGRREVLASIVDLERYERLFHLADDARKQRDAQIKLLGQQLSVLPPVADEQLAEARDSIAVAEQKRETARAEVVRFQGLEFQAREWAKLQGRLNEARERCRQANALLADAESIEKAVERLRDLREWLPQLRDVHTQRGLLHQAKIEAEKVARQKQDLVVELDRCEAALKQARGKRNLSQQLIDQAEQRQREVGGRLRELAGQMEKLNQYERHEADLAGVRADLRGLPADPTGMARQAREAYEALAALASVVPVVARFRARREELRRAVDGEQAAQKAEQEVLERGKRIAAEAERLKPIRDQAAVALEEATRKATEAGTLLKQARDSLREVTSLDGSKVCRHCGQALTPGHLAEEKRRREGAVVAAERQEKQASAAARAARESERRAREQYEQADKARQDARLEYGDSKNKLAQARLEVQRLHADCGQLYHEVPAELRVRVSPAAVEDWRATTWPEGADLERLQEQASGLEAARRKRLEAEQVQQRWVQCKAREESALDHLEHLRRELPADRAALRQRHDDAVKEETEAATQLEGRRAELKEIERELEQWTRKREQLQGRQVALDGELKKQEVQREHAAQTIARALKNLPECWRPVAEQFGTAELADWTAELDELQKARTEERGRELAAARINRDVLQRDLDELETQQEGFPEEARQEVSILRGRLAAAQEADRACEREVSQAQQRHAGLEAQRRQREKIAEEMCAAERELQADRTLAELLGRDRLQLFLVRQAERQVVEFANAVLDRLSGGQLYLKLSGEANGEGGSDKALDLEAYNRGTGEKPINVAFLSGSQKFRVAVSLALGIGQYASRQHRPIEAVIIDEGFGCLDSQGRLVMIQELQNLRNQMRCILLVSHQEEFADAFPDGFHFFLEGGAARIRPFQK